MPIKDGADQLPSPRRYVLPLAVPVAEILLTAIDPANMLLVTLPLPIPVNAA